jgi:hypothetical protein
MNYLIIEAELDYEDMPPYNEYDKSISIRYAKTLDEAFEIARQLQRDNPICYRHEIIEIGTKWVI